MASPAFADSGNQDLPSFLQSIGCSTTYVAVPDNWTADQQASYRICKEAAFGLCNDPGANGCGVYFQNQTYKPSSQVHPFDFQWGTSSSSAEFQAKVQDAQRKVDPYLAKARACCAGDTSCQLVGEPNQAKSNLESANAMVRARTSNGGSIGGHESCQLLADGHKNSSIQSSGYAGLCKAYRETCVRRYDSLTRVDASAVCSGCAPGEVDQAMNSFKQNMQVCEGLQATIPQIAVQEMSQSQLQAMGCSMNTQSINAGNGGNSNTGTAGTGTTNGSKTPGTGSGLNMGTLASVALPLMQAMMQQNQETPEEIPPVGDCTSNPALAGCQGMQAAGSNSWTPQSVNGSASNTAGSGGSGTFNLPDNGDTVTGPSDITPQSVGTPPTVNPVQNGGGGGFAMGSSGAATLGAGGQVGAGLQPMSNKADILHGESSPSGYSQMAAGMTMAPGGGGGGFSSYGSGDPGIQPLNLAEFLPGGRHDPTRKLAGALATGLPQNGIQGKNVNIFNRISEHIRRRCAQGLLRDCGPR